MPESEIIKSIICIVVNSEIDVELKMPILRWLFEEERTAAVMERLNAEKNQ